ncbi:agmatine deiminase [Spirosomataceae bacterium TFI 002]|nr:agmatine deiminase [Spirosomataceae bacterium TFI 002]
MTPKENGFSFPAEWEKHAATWLTYPHNIETWEDRLPKVQIQYNAFVKAISEKEFVNIICRDEEHSHEITIMLEKANTQMANVKMHLFGSNDSWCRDHGPAFLINREKKDKILVNWEYNAWGGKYPPFDLDNAVPQKVASYLGVNCVTPGIVMEGGSIEVNGLGDLITTEACLLNKNRNPNLTKEDIESALIQYYGVQKIHWLDDGIIGDDTDGHIDDTVRFVNNNTVVAAFEENTEDENHKILQTNIDLLEKIRLVNGDLLNIIKLPMPSPVFSEGVRLPASYANFYICNERVIVPIYNCSNDQIALEIIQSCFPNHEVIGLASDEIIWGLGSFHCLSQQEPLL